MSFLSKLRFRLPVALLCLLPVTVLAQTTRNVGPGQPYTTIQSGIDAASTGDTVLVAPGTYHEHIDFKGKAITVTSSGGAGATIIDGDGTLSMAAVVFHTGETASSVLSGFTIRNGGDNNFYFGQYYGGIFMQSAAPVIRNNIITANYCTNIAAIDSSPTVENNIISKLTHNTGPSTCTLTGGLLFQNARLGTSIVRGNTFEDNVDGSAIFVYGSSNLSIVGNIIRNNTSQYAATALNITGDGVVVVNNLIYGNNSGCGGVISFGNATVLSNNTIVDNVRSGVANGSECTPVAQIYASAYTYGRSSPDNIVINNIISGSTSYPAIQCDVLSTTPDESHQSLYQNNILYNSAGPVFGNRCVDVSGKYNNIVADPQLVNPAAGDFHLKATSPAIDKGANTGLDPYTVRTGAPLTTDFDGNSRIQDGTGTGCIVDMGAFEYPGSMSACAPTLTLTSSLNPSNYGQNVTFTATLSSASGTPTGSVQFADGATTLGTSLVSSAGVATYSTGALTAGTHTITANYLPTGSFPSATKSLVQVVNGYATSTTITCTPANLSLGSRSSITVGVTAAGGLPAGSAITFSDNGVARFSISLTNGTVTFPYTAAAAGTHSFSAAYIRNGNYEPSSATCPVTVNAAPSSTTLSASPTLSTYGSTVTLKATVAPQFVPNAGAPTGTVTFLDGGSSIGNATVSNGVATLSLNTLPGGSNSVSCTYAGDTNYARSNCNTLVLQVNPVATQTVITPTPNPSYVGQQVQVPVAVTSASGAIPAGTVILFDGATAISTLTLDASAKAVFTLNNLAIGTHPLSVRYTPASQAFLSSTSAIVNEVVGASDFTITLLPTALTLKAGTTGATSVQLGSQGVFTGPLALSIGTLPTNATATFKPATVTMTAGSSGTATLTVNTQGPFAKVAGLQPPPTHIPAKLILAAFAIIMLPLARRRTIARALVLIAMAASLGGLVGCTDIYSIAPVVATGTYTIPVTATDTSGNSHSANLTLTVTP